RCAEQGNPVQPFQRLVAVGNVPGRLGRFAEDGQPADALGRVVELQQIGDGRRDLVVRLQHDVDRVYDPFPGDHVAVVVQRDDREGRVPLREVDQVQTGERVGRRDVLGGVQDEGKYISSSDTFTGLN